VRRLVNKPDKAPSRHKQTMSDSNPIKKSHGLVPVLTELTDQDIEGKRVLVRADLNVLNEWGKLIADASFENLLPTVRFLQERKAEKTLLLGTAQNAAEYVKEIFDMQRIGDLLQEQLKLPVITIKHYRGADAASAVEQTPHGCIVLLGNVGADSREKEDNEKNRQVLAHEIVAALKIDLYVNDAPRASKHAY